MPGNGRSDGKSARAHEPSSKSRTGTRTRFMSGSIAKIGQRVAMVLPPPCSAGRIPYNGKWGYMGEHEACHQETYATAAEAECYRTRTPPGAVRRRGRGPG